MLIELIGYFTFAAGLLTLWRGPNFGIYLLAFASLLASAAALQLPAVGGASVQPVHLLLPFYLLSVALTFGPARFVEAMRFPSPGIWLWGAVAYALIGAIFLPRLFAGAVQLFSIARDEQGIILSDLGPSPANITQAGYFTGDALCFCAVFVHARYGSISTVGRALLFAATCNLLLAVADVATYATGTTDMLDFIRNANYRMLADGDIAGVKRLVGSFTEAGAFGTYTVGAFAFCAELWLRGFETRRTGVLALLLLIASLLSTSTSTYVTIAIYLVIFYLRCGTGLLRGNATPRAAAVVAVVPVLAILTLLLLMMLPNVWTAINDLIELTLLKKLESQSGVERASWNEHAFKIFLQTGLLGAGMGSVRGSSYVFGVLANLGLIGSLLMAGFFGGLIVRARRNALTRNQPIAAAAAWAAFTSFIIAALSSSLFIVFAIYAGLISAIITERAGPARLGNAVRQGSRERRQRSLLTGHTA